MKHSKLYACLSYLSILIIIPALVPGKDSKAACYWQDSVDSVMASIK